MLKIICCSIRLIIVLLVISGFTMQAQAETLRVGFFPLIPHAIPDKEGSPGGSAVEYFRIIAEKMGIRDIVFKNLPLPRLLKHLEGGKEDIALILAKNPEREKMFVYPGTPFSNTRPAIVVSHDSPLRKIETAEDLLSLKIGTWAQGYHSPMIQDKRLKIIPIRSENVVRTGIRMVMKGRMDAFYSPDSHPLMFEIKKENYESKLRLLPLPEAGIPNFSVFSRKSAEKYLSQYEAALNEVRKNKTYKTFATEFIKNYR